MLILRYAESLPPCPGFCMGSKKLLQRNLKHQYDASLLRLVTLAY